MVEIAELKRNGCDLEKYLIENGAIINLENNTLRCKIYTTSPALYSFSVSDEVLFNCLTYLKINDCVFIDKKLYNIEIAYNYGKDVRVIEADNYVIKWYSIKNRIIKEAPVPIEYVVVDNYSYNIVTKLIVNNVVIFDFFETLSEYKCKQEEERRKNQYANKEYEKLDNYSLQREIDITALQRMASQINYYLHTNFIGNDNPDVYEKKPTKRERRLAKSLEQCYIYLIKELNKNE